MLVLTGCLVFSLKQTHLVVGYQVLATIIPSIMFIQCPLKLRLENKLVAFPQPIFT